MHTLRPTFAGIFITVSIGAKDVKLLGISTQCAVAQAVALNQVTVKTEEMTNNSLPHFPTPSRIELANTHLTCPGPWEISGSCTTST
jgi:hypothetical protein